MTCTIILCVCVYEVTCHVQLFATLWTLVCQALLSMGFSRQVYWSGLPFPPPDSLPEPEIEPASLVSLAWHACSLPLAPPGKPYYCYTYTLY